MKVAVLSMEQIRIGCKLRYYFNFPFKLHTTEMYVSPNVSVYNKQVKSTETFQDVHSLLTHKRMKQHAWLIMSA